MIQSSIALLSVLVVMAGQEGREDIRRKPVEGYANVPFDTGGGEQPPDFRLTRGYTDVPLSRWVRPHRLKDLEREPTEEWATRSAPSSEEEAAPPRPLADPIQQDREAPWPRRVIDFMEGYLPLLILGSIIGGAMTFHIMKKWYIPGLLDEAEARAERRGFVEGHRDGAATVPRSGTGAGYDAGYDRGYEDGRNGHPHRRRN